MKEPYSEGLASHAGPESCAGVHKGAGEALTGVRAGRVFSREIFDVWGADPLRQWGRQHRGSRNGKAVMVPTRSKTLSTHGSTLRENREIPRSPVADGAAGRVGKPKGVIRR